MNYFTCFLLLTISIIWVFGNDDNLYDDDYYDDDYGNDDDDADDDRIKSSNSTTNSTIIFVQPPKNLTVESGRRFIKFICDVKNILTINDFNNTNQPKIIFKWEKNFVEIEKSKKFGIHNERLKPPNNNNNNNEIIYRSILRIKDIEFFDKSMYDCIANNGIDTIKQQYFLDVERDPKWGITSPLNLNNNINKFNIDATTLIPDGGGGGRGGTKIGLIGGNDGGGKTFDLPPSGKIPIPQRTFSDNNNNNNNNGGGGGNKNNRTIEPFCQIYNGHTCRHYLTNKYIFVQPPYTQKEIEDKLSNAFLVISQSNDISPSCNKLAHPSLCYSAFPLCIDPKSVNLYQIKHYKRNLLPLFNNNNNNIGNNFNNNNNTNIRSEITDNLRRICKDDCLLLETELCSKEYAIAKRHPVIGQTLELEECQYLPDETEASSKNCLNLGIDNQSDKDDKCYWDNGILYRGIKNISETGRTCLRWSHQIHIPISQYPELTGHNYCRNPGGISAQPFCYIDQNKRELCDITKCAHVAAIYIIGIIVGIAAFLSILIGIFCCRKKTKPRNIQNISVPSADKNIYGNPGPNSPIELNSLLPPNIPPLPPHHPHHQQPQQQKRYNQSKNNYQNVPQYTYKEVSFVEELGEGAFGKVYKGELKTPRNGKIIVAVKSLKENANAKTQADFQREIELISELKHPNIICLLGVVIKQEPMCMLFEFMSEGDLHEFLIANSPSEGKSLTQNQFLHIAIQIAQGMEYLSENHYVHRDLAARNCLVSCDFVVKISDFGLSRDMYSCDYYRVQSKSLLPVRWMPPESILYGKFTTESDVWSYGVVLWEIYSYGLQPYYGYNNQEVINMIRSRKLLPCPDACPSYCYSLMIECWAELAIRRPSFPEITHRLKVWKQNGGAAIQNGAYFKTIPAVQQKFGHCSKDQESLTTTPSTTWERNCRLNESQTSLTSRSSSLGNRTQSTNLSNEQQQQQNSKRRRRNDDTDRSPNLKNTVVNTNGDNFEIKISTTN